MSFIDTLNGLLTDDSKTFFMSNYFDSRIDIPLSSQMLDEPPEAAYILNQVTRNMENFKKLVEGVNFDLYLEMQSVNDPAKLLSLWITYLNAQ